MHTDNIVDEYCNVLSQYCPGIYFYEGKKQACCPALVVQILYYSKLQQLPTSFNMNYIYFGHRRSTQLIVVSIHCCNNF